MDLVLPTSRIVPAASKLSSEVCEVQVLQSETEIDQIQTYWRQWTLHPNAEVDCYKAVLDGSATGTSPFVLVLSRNGAPDAMLVGRLENGRLALKMGYLPVLNLRVRQLVFVYGGLLGNSSRENCAKFVAAVSEKLREGIASVALFNGVQTGTPLYEAARNLPGVLMRDRVATAEIHRSMSVPHGVASLNQSLSAKVRKNLGWQARKLLKDFPDKVVVRCFSSVDDLDQAFHDVEEVAAVTYQRQLEVGFADSAVIRRRLKAEAANKWLRVYVLYIDGKPSAFWIGKLHKQTFYSDFMGYDPVLSKYSPGTFLLMRAMEELCERDSIDRALKVDFGFGDAQYKKVFGNMEWHEASIYIFGSSIKALGLNVIRTTVGLIDGLGKKILVKLNLLQSTKTLWRRQTLKRAEGNQAAG